MWRSYPNKTWYKKKCGYFYHINHIRDLLVNNQSIIICLYDKESEPCYWLSSLLSNSLLVITTQAIDLCLDILPCVWSNGSLLHIISRELVAFPSYYSYSSWCSILYPFLIWQISYGKINFNFFSNLSTLAHDFKTMGWF